MQSITKTTRHHCALVHLTVIITTQTFYLYPMGGEVEVQSDHGCSEEGNCTNSTEAGCRMRQLNAQG